VHHVGKFAAVPMTMAQTTFSGVLVAGLLMLGCMASPAQDSSAPSLGDLARKTRAERSAPGHVAGKQLVNQEEDGPDTTGVWRIQLCSRTPCHELSVTLPKNPAWKRAADEPRPVLIPLPGATQDPKAEIRLYNAESLGPLYSPLDGAKRVFLQGWFSRPEYFGQGARTLLDEHVQVDNDQGLVSHFSVMSGATKYRGLSIVVGIGTGNYGFACVYRERDADEAGSICDAIINSAHSEVLEPGTRPKYPSYRKPPQYYPGDDPPEDSPADDNPE
jgi:hypothetical protein